MEVEKNYQPPRKYAPSKLPPRNDDAYALPMVKAGTTHGHSHNICHKFPVYAFAFFVALCTVLLVFSLVVLRPNSPNLWIVDVSVKDPAYDKGDSPFLNATVVAGLTLKNTNFGRFVFEGNGSVLGFVCEGVVVGEREIGGGSVAARETGRIEVEVAVATGNLSRGIGQGVLELRSFGRIGGKVHLLKYVKRSLSAELNCAVRLSLATLSFQDLHCE